MKYVLTLTCQNQPHLFAAIAQVLDGQAKKLRYWNEGATSSPPCWSDTLVCAHGTAVGKAVLIPEPADAAPEWVIDHADMWHLRTIASRLHSSDMPMSLSARREAATQIDGILTRLVPLSHTEGA